MWIETDLEPDELIALYIFSKAGFTFDYVVVGEGNSKIKTARIRKYCELLNIKPVVIEGLPSSKSFENDGKEFNNLEMKDADHFVNNYEAQLREYIDSTANPVIVSLKPMRELISCYKELSLANAKLFVYGSFNFRCLKSETFDLNTLTDMFQKFKKVNIFETYYALGEKNACNNDTTPKLIDKFMSNNNIYLNYTKKLMELWDADIIEDCKETCISILKKYNIDDLSWLNEKLNKDYFTEHNASNDDISRFLRNKKTFLQVSYHKGKQWVAADVGLALVMSNGNISPIPISLKFDSSGYTIATKCNENKINMYYAKESLSVKDGYTSLDFLTEEMIRYL